MYRTIVWRPRPYCSRTRKVLARDWRRPPGLSSRWWDELLGSLSRGEALGHDGVGRRVECHADVSTRYFHIHIRVHRHAITPIDDAIMTGINGGFDHRVGHLAPERFQEIAGTFSRVAVRKYS